MRVLLLSAEGARLLDVPQLAPVVRIPRVRDEPNWFALLDEDAPSRCQTPHYREYRRLDVCTYEEQA